MSCTFYAFILLFSAKLTENFCHIWYRTHFPRVHDPPSNRLSLHRVGGRLESASFADPWNAKAYPCHGNCFLLIAWKETKQVNFKFLLFHNATVKNCRSEAINVCAIYVWKKIFRWWCSFCFVCSSPLNSTKKSVKSFTFEGHLSLTHWLFSSTFCYRKFVVPTSIGQNI